MTTTRTLICAALLALASCKTNTTGDSGRLTFRFLDADQLLTQGLETGIATGTVARLEVKSSTGSESKVASVQFGDSAVAELDRTDGSFVYIRGLTEGDTQFTVETSAGVSDGSSIRVVDAARVKLAVLGQADRVLVGGVEPLAVRRENEAGQTLVGEAEVKDVLIEPSDSAGRLAGPDHRVLIKYQTEGEVTLSVAGGPSITRTVVGLDQVAKFALIGPTDGQSFTLEDTIVSGYTIEDAAGEELGARLQIVDVTSDPASVCIIEEGDFLGIVGFRVVPLKAGSCTVTASLGDMSESFTIELTEPTE